MQTKVFCEYLRENGNFNVLSNNKNRGRKSRVHKIGENQNFNKYSMQFQLVPHFSLSVQDTYQYMYCIGPPPPLGLWAVQDTYK